MKSVEELKSKGIQKVSNDALGHFHLYVESGYFGQQVELIFRNQKNRKNSDDWNQILERTNQFLALNENVIGWMKDILWENYLYAIEDADYGLDEIIPDEEINNVSRDKITILNDMPSANIENIKFNMNHFKIFHKNQILTGSKIELVEFGQESITFVFSTIWDDEHDVYIHTNNYIHLG